MSTVQVKKGQFCYMADVVTAGSMAKTSFNVDCLPIQLILAPMVRISTLPTRLLSISYGADQVYSPELVDKAIIGSVRTVIGFLAETGVVQYRKEGRLIFSTHEQERNHLVLQLGSSNAELALQAALHVKEDVGRIDLNCGCPKSFSLQAGMGAALLKEPEKLVSILENLVQHFGQRISCKIRLLDTLEETLHLIERVQNTGIIALAIHTRYVSDRSDRVPARHNWLPQIISHMRIPLILNGDFSCGKQIVRFLEQFPTVRCFMLARAVESGSPIVFSKIREAILQEQEIKLSSLSVNSTNTQELEERGLSMPYDFSKDHQSSYSHISKLHALEQDPVILVARLVLQYVRLSIQLQHPFTNAKYVLMQYWRPDPKYLQWYSSPENSNYNDFNQTNRSVLKNFSVGHVSFSSPQSASHLPSINACPLGSRILHSTSYQDILAACSDYAGPLSLS